MSHRNEMKTEMFVYYLETLLFRTLLRMINLFSLAATRRIGRTLGLLNFHIVKVRCAVVKRQLEEAFPELSEKEIHKLIREINISSGYTAVEFCWFSPRKVESFEKFIYITGSEYLKEALSQKRGCIIFSGHFGNWELAAQLIGYLSGNIYAVAKKQKNPYFNSLINDLRESNNVYLIPKKGALRGIIDALKANRSILMLGDQNAGKTGVPANFFGIPAQTNPGTAKIALRFDVPIIFSVCHRLRNGKFHLRLEKSIIPKAQNSVDEAVCYYTQFFTTRLEQWVRKYPEQWFWFHRRWKV